MTKLVSVGLIHSIEWIIVILIIGIQGFVFIYTLKRINIFKRIFPFSSRYSLTDDMPHFGYDTDPSYLESDKGNTRYLNYSPTDSPYYIEIIHSINRYLHNNKGTISDFNLVKDIVDRRLDAIDEEINTTLPIPIYLGLAGTMLGIVIGLFFLPSVTSQNFLDGEGVNILLSAVKIAMIASFIGLVLTTINSGIFYKGAKSYLERRKNEFFTFFQAEMLPILSQNVTSSLYSLQNNLINFNNNFGNNVAKFEIIMNKIHDSYQMQYDLMEMFTEMDIKEIADLNVRVLRELRSSTKEFQIFNSYLHNVNAFIKNTESLNNHLLDLLDKTDNLSSLVQKIDQTFSINKDLLDFLSISLRDLDNHKYVVKNSVSDVSDLLKKSLAQLEQVVLDQNEKNKIIISNLSDTSRKGIDELHDVLLERISFFSSSMEKISSEFSITISEFKEIATKNLDDYVVSKDTTQNSDFQNNILELIGSMKEQQSIIASKIPELELQLKELYLRNTSNNLVTKKDSGNDKTNIPISGVKKSDYQDQEGFNENSEGLKMRDANEIQENNEKGSAKKRTFIKTLKDFLLKPI